MRHLTLLFAGLCVLVACSSSGTSASSPSFCVDWCTAVGGQDAGPCAFSVSSCAGDCTMTRKWFEEVDAGAICRSEWMAFKECIANKGTSLCGSPKACTAQFGAFRSCTSPSASDDDQFVGFYGNAFER